MEAVLGGYAQLAHDPQAVAFPHPAKNLKHKPVAAGEPANHGLAVVGFRVVPETALLDIPDFAFADGVLPHSSPRNVVTEYFPPKNPMLALVASVCGQRIASRT